MIALKAFGIMLAGLLIFRHTVVFIHDYLVMRELRRQVEWNEHLMAAEWLIQEVSERADEAGRFPWEA